MPKFTASAEFSEERIRAFALSKGWVDTSGDPVLDGGTAKEFVVNYFHELLTKELAELAIAEAELELKRKENALKAEREQTKTAITEQVAAAVIVTSE